MIIVVAGQKGGVGKTTLAVNLAVMRVMAGKNAYLLDIDEQLTSTIWASVRDEYGITPRIESTQKVLNENVLSKGIAIRNELKALSKTKDDIIVDAGGANNEVLRGALTIADIILFPLQPADFDMWTVRTINRLTAEAQSGDDIKKAHVVYTLVPTNPAEAKNDIAKCDELLKDFEYLKRLDSFFYRRKPISKANGQGMAIIEYKPTDEKAIEEIKTIYKEIFNEK